MDNQISSSLSSEDRKQIAGGLFFIDDGSVQEPAFVNQFQNLDNHVIEWASSVRELAP
jgi:hypothetical protein